jgi:hypothetical protein
MYAFIMAVGSSSVGFFAAVNAGAVSLVIPPAPPVTAEERWLDGDG